MGLFDKFKKKTLAVYDEESGTYRVEKEGIIFSYEEEPENIDEIDNIIKSYKKQFENIIDFMMPDIKETYGEFSNEEIAQKLGKPIIDHLNGIVTYCEQTFDDVHIFTFEFLDEEFKELQYFAIDG